MILVIDVGNTRLKWAWLTSTGLSDQQAIVHRDVKPAIWTAALFDASQKPAACWYQQRRRRRRWRRR